MTNHILRFYIKPENIKDKISPECKNIKILSTNLYDDGIVEIECIVSENEIISHDDVRFALFSEESVPLDKI